MRGACSGAAGPALRPKVRFCLCDNGITLRVTQRLPGPGHAPSLDAVGVDLPFGTVQFSHYISPKPMSHAARPSEADIRAHLRALDDIVGKAGVSGELQGSLGAWRDLLADMLESPTSEQRRVMVWTI